MYDSAIIFTNLQNDYLGELLCYVRAGNIKHLYVSCDMGPHDFKTAKDMHWHPDRILFFNSEFFSGAQDLITAYKCKHYMLCE